MSKYSVRTSKHILLAGYNTNLILGNVKIWIEGRDVCKTRHSSCTRFIQLKIAKTAWFYTPELPTIMQHLQFL